MEFQDSCQSQLRAPITERVIGRPRLPPSRRSRAMRRSTCGISSGLAPGASQALRRILRRAPRVVAASLLSVKIVEESRGRFAGGAPVRCGTGSTARVGSASCAANGDSSCAASMRRQRAVAARLPSPGERATAGVRRAVVRLERGPPVWRARPRALAAFVAATSDDRRAVAVMHLQAAEAPSWRSRGRRLPQARSPG